MKFSGLIYDNSTHYLDHLAPFCSLLNCPLIICEKSLAEQARQLYPNVKILHINYFEVRLTEYTITCDNAPLIKAAFPHQYTQTLWLPHGRSDKGYKSNFFESLVGEKVIFVYGPDMEKQLKNVQGKKIQIGNFRQKYYLKNKSFYEKKVPFYSLKNKILYAPSWDDSETNSSFWKAFPGLSKNLPPNLHLLIKFHPNTISKYHAETELLIGRFHKENIHVVPDFPPIYPILNEIDAYIGDMSSIGYDYLSMKGPMFFLNANKDLPLHQCGTAIDSINFDFLSNSLFLNERKQLYQQTFAKTPDFSAIKEELFCEL